MTSSLERRLAAAEERARAAAAGGKEAAMREALAALSGDELLDLAATHLAVYGVDPAVAREVYENAWMLHGRHPDAGLGRTWADLAARADDILRVYLDDLRWRAKLGGASPEAAARLKDPAFRRLVRETACRAFGWKDGLELYVQAWGWAVARVAAGAPPESCTRAAYAADREWHEAYQRYEAGRMWRAG